LFTGGLCSGLRGGEKGRRARGVSGGGTPTIIFFYRTKGGQGGGRYGRRVRFFVFWGGPKNRALRSRGFSPRNQGRNQTGGPGGRVDSDLWKWGFCFGGGGEMSPFRKQWGEKGTGDSFSPPKTQAASKPGVGEKKNTGGGDRKYFFLTRTLYLGRCLLGGGGAGRSGTVQFATKKQTGAGPRAG